MPQAKGEKLATYGLTEPGAGSDVVGARSTARREGDEWVLNGEKMWISLADVADNFLFFCWTDEEKRRKRDHTGMSCFIVERSMKGFSSGTIHGKLGIRAGNTGYFSLQDVRVPQENMVGEEGEGFKIAMFALEQGRYTVASGATGVIRASRDASVAYANTRETFGTKIANHQLVKQKIAEMEADYQMSHLLWLHAGYLKNEGKPNAKATSLAKWQATMRSEKAASMAIEVHGANGYSNDYPVERYLRNCKAAIIYEGTRDIHTLMQADWALGLKKEKPARRTLPPWKRAIDRKHSRHQTAQSSLIGLLLTLVLFDCVQIYATRKTSQAQRPTLPDRISHLRPILELVSVLVHTLGFLEIQLQSLDVQRSQRVKLFRFGDAIVIFVLPQSQAVEDLSRDCRSAHLHSRHLQPYQTLPAQESHSY